MLGRHRKALAHLGLLFKHRKIGKTYWAIVEGGPVEDEGTIDLALGRLDDKIGWWMKPDPHGLPAGDQVEGDGQKQLGGFPLPCFPFFPLSRLRARAGRGKPRVGTLVRMEQARGFPLRLSPPQKVGRARGKKERVQVASHSLGSPSSPSPAGPISCGCTRAAQGCPLVGDDIYGTAPRFRGPVMHLHAREIVVPISKNKPPARASCGAAAGAWCASA